MQTSYVKCKLCRWNIGVHVEFITLILNASVPTIGSVSPSDIFSLTDKS